MPTSGLDIRGTVIAAKIFSPDSGKWADLSVNKASDASADHFPYLQEIQVKEQISGFGEVRLIIAPPTYRESLELLESPFLYIGNTLGVRFGYSVGGAASISPWIWYMTLMPEPSFGDEFSFTVPATSFAFLPSMVQTGTVWNNALQQPNNKIPNPKKYTIPEVIDELAKKYGFEIWWNRSADKFIGAKGTFSEHAVKVFESKDVPLVQSGLSDWLYIKHLAALGGCRASISSGRILNIVDTRLVQDPVATFRYRGQVDFANNIYPFDSFDGESSAMFFPRQGIDSTLFDLDAKKFQKLTKTEETESTTATTAENNAVAGPPKDAPGVQTVAGVVAKATNMATRAATDQMPVASRDKLAQTKLKNYMSKSADQHGVSAKITAIDVPFVLPDDLVKIEGMGKYFSVVYRVFEIERRYGMNFAESTYSLKPKGLAGNIASWLRGKALVTKPAKPKTSPGGNTKQAKQGS